MDLEDSTMDDYSIRISQYQYYRLQNQANMQIKNLQNELAEEQERVEELRSSMTSSVEIIGIFAGVVSFVLGSLSLADGQTAVHASLLIATLMGALIVVFAVFAMLLRASDKSYNRKMGYICIALGLTMVIISTVVAAQVPGA